MLSSQEEPVYLYPIYLWIYTNVEILIEKHHLLKSLER
jgi:hypothetical protein